MYIRAYCCIIALLKLIMVIEMKTKQEIEKMKNEIQLKIEGVSNQMFEVCNCSHPSPSMEILSDEKRQLMAQYNILLEVLNG